MLVPRWVCRAAVVLGAAGLVAYCVCVVALEPFRWRNIAWFLALLAPLYAVGVLAYRRRRDLSIARLMVLVGGLWAAHSGLSHVVYAYLRGGGAPDGVWPLALLAGALGVSAQASAATMFALFPDGRCRWRHERVFVAIVVATVPLAVVGQAAAASTMPVDVEYDAIDVANPLAVSALASVEPAAELSSGFVLLPVAFVLLVLRYWWSGPRARGQIRWLLVVLVAAAFVAAAAAIVDLADARSPWLDAAGFAAEYAVLALVPITLVLAILRDQLLDVDVVLRRSLVYGSLWLAIGLAYVGAASGVGLAGSRLLPLTLVVVLTVVATVAFQPARRLLERLADRAVFGRRLRGYELLGHLGATLEEAVDRQQLPLIIADAVRSGLRLSWARVVLHVRVDGSVDREMVTTSGEGAGAASQAVALTHGGETVGTIECGPRRDGAWTPDDLQVLATLARQASLALHNARLGAELRARLDDIRRQADELKASRARIVHATEEERRRIERDLHDGAQQQIVALMAKVQLARNNLVRDPARAEAILTELQAEAATLHDDLIELARGIHPPVLSDRGLAEAIQSRAERLPIAVTLVTTPAMRETRFSDQIEGAAYFVASEALTNVLKHGHAHRAVVHLSCHDGHLRLSVSDDGRGIHDGPRRGSGLANMADRLEALGGRLTVTSPAGGGTCVEAELPASAAESPR
ncbi:GAF domain-containing sensor histidine kinase [Jiangella asiatica]|uniref:histidine kinase n=1 Tax=Jiangella asiatica TaxID=2530372 RepID=A0A4R5DH79_9ACTN|nr:GAF domain-containing sensor histidine kinase [Jiangella asiatica]TDE11214.1 GAF domain-containing protein [Jiangella asiatica]